MMALFCEMNITSEKKSEIAKQNHCEILRNNANRIENSASFCSKSLLFAQSCFFLLKVAHLCSQVAQSCSKETHLRHMLHIVAQKWLKGAQKWLKVAQMSTVRV